MKFFFILLIFLPSLSFSSTKILFLPQTHRHPVVADTKDQIEAIVQSRLEILNFLVQQKGKPIVVFSEGVFGDLAINKNHISKVSQVLIKSHEHKLALDSFIEKGIPSRVPFLTKSQFDLIYGISPEYIALILGLVMEVRGNGQPIGHMDQLISEYYPKMREIIENGGSFRDVENSDFYKQKFLIEREVSILNQIQDFVLRNPERGQNWIIMVIYGGSHKFEVISNYPGLTIERQSYKAEFRQCSDLLP